MEKTKKEKRTKNVLDNMFKMSILETTFTHKAVNKVRCTIAFKPSDVLNPIEKGYDTIMERLAKGHPEIKVKRSVFDGPTFFIHADATCHPDDVYRESTGMHIAETKARLRLNNFMYDVVTEYAEEKKKELKSVLLWQEEYLLRVKNNDEHLADLYNYHVTPKTNQ